MFNRKSESNFVSIHIHINVGRVVKWLKEKGEVGLRRFRFTDTISFRIELLPNKGGISSVYHCHEGVHSPNWACEFFHQGMHFTSGGMLDEFYAITVDREIIGLAPTMPIFEMIAKGKHNSVGDNPLSKEGSRIVVTSADEHGLDWEMKMLARNSEVIAYSNELVQLEFALQPPNQNMPYEKPF